MNKLLSLLAAASLAFAAPAWGAALPKPAAAPQAERVVLPAEVTPERYEIRVTPDPEALTFRGHARIAVVVHKPTERIVLNAADLKLERAALSGVDAAPRTELNDAEQTAAFVFERALAPGRYVLEIDYTGRIFQQAFGLFALDGLVDGRPSRALFTQFENSDARRFAPMWDEPAAKAVFSLTVETPAGQTAFSNMPAAKLETLPDGRTATTFADTPRMSSYLLFLGLGDLQRIARKVGAVEIGLVALRGQAEKGRFALDSAADMLPWFDDYFGKPYPLPKLDLIAGPGQSQFFAAMENWGAIFAFERNLLLEPEASPAERQRVFTIVAHEMAHQWFGNLVTMAWWDDLWLNEGFTSWMESKAADHFHPEWKVSLQEMASRERAMRLDAGAGTHPVITPIRDVFAAANAFDAITYQKGQAVVAMLEQYVGEEAFRAGIRAYIARHAYGNTTTDQLWEELERVSPRPVTKVAHDFTLQAGVPLIRAEPAPGGLRLTQSQFGRSGSPRGDGTWLTPVRVAAPRAAQPWVGLVSAPKPRRVPVAGGPAIVNFGQSGYFRNRYAPELWSRLAPSYLNLAPADQLGLLYDSRALGESGAIPMGDFLALARTAAQATDPVVLTALANELAALARVYPPDAGEAYRAYARARLSPILARVGWDPRPGEGHNVPALRDTLVRTLSDLDDPQVRAEALRRFKASVGRPGSLSGALAQTVQGAAARHADATVWEQLHRLARTGETSSERARFYRLLGVAKDLALADRALALALSGEPPPTTAPAIIAAVAALHPDKAFDFAIAHRPQVEALLEPTSRATFFVNLARASRDKEMLRKLDAFAGTIPDSSRGEVRKAEAEIRNRRDFADRGLPELDRWVAANPG